MIVYQGPVELGNSTYQDCAIEVLIYTSNNTPGLAAWNHEGQVATFTRNLVDERQDNGPPVVWLDFNNLGYGVAEVLKKAGLIEENPCAIGKSGFSTYPGHRLVGKALDAWNEMISSLNESPQEEDWDDGQPTDIQEHEDFAHDNDYEGETL